MKRTMNVLVIDDDKELCELLHEYMEPEGFLVEAVNAPGKGLKKALSGKYDLVVLDVMMPGMNGFDLLRNLRISSQIPVLMLTARGEDIDRILGLEMGADDYLPKPFNPRELLARINAIQRRIQTNNTDCHDKQLRIKLDDIMLDMGARMVRQGESSVNLTAVEFLLLYELLNNAGRVLTREDLTEKVLNRELNIFDRSIDVHVSNLRKKLGQQVDGRERIRTIRSVGYLYTLPQKEL